jgi:hypothetical protein
VSFLQKIFLVKSLVVFVLGNSVSRETLIFNLNTN